MLFALGLDESWDFAVDLTVRDGRNVPLRLDVDVQGNWPGIDGEICNRRSNLPINYLLQIAVKMAFNLDFR